MTVAAARVRAKLAGQPSPAGELTTRVLAGYRRSAGDRGRGVESDQVAAARGRLDVVIAGLLLWPGCAGARSAPCAVADADQ